MLQNQLRRQSRKIHKEKFYMKKTEYKRACIPKARKRYIYMLPVFSLLLFFCCFKTVRAGDSFVHTHTDACTRQVSVLCDYEHTSYSSHEIITRHCGHCQAQTQHSHYLTNYVCEKTGCRETVAGSTACLTCHNPGYSWGTNAFSHYREDKVYICGAGQSEVTARATLTGAGTHMTNQDMVLSAGVEIKRPELSGSGFSYSWDGGSTWTKETARTISENGAYTVLVKNQRGEIADASVTVACIDKIAPVIDLITADTAGMTMERILVTVLASDENGIAGYSFDGGAAWQGDGSCQIQAGKLYQVRVKDEAGNIAEKEIRREDFPLPAQPATPAKKPEDSVHIPSADTPRDTQGSAKQEADFCSTGTIKRTAEQKQKSLRGMAGEASKKTGKAAENSEKDEAFGKMKPYSGLVPKITVSQNKIKENTVSESCQSENAGALTASKEALQAEAGNVRELQAGSQSILYSGALTAGLFLAAVVAVCLLLYALKSGVLYAVEDTGERPLFRRLQRVRLQKGQKGYTMTLPEYVERLEGSGHFRILLSKRWLKEGKSGQVSIYTGKRKLVADMEECIDFVL